MAISLILVGSLILGAITYYLWQWSYWMRRGIGGPRGYPIVGVLDKMLDHWSPPGIQLREWTKKYGPIYGITEGVQKTLITSDADFVNEVFVRQFDNFYGRKLNPLQGDPNANKRVHLFAAQGHRWKRLRTLSSPTFSNNSLRRILQSVEESALELLGHLEAGVDANGQTVDMLAYYQEFTLDVIGKVAMGQTDSLMFRNPMLEKVKAIFGGERKNMFLIAGTFPVCGAVLRHIFTHFPSLSPAFGIFDVIEKAVGARIAQRDSDARRGVELGEPQDFIDLFLDARADVDFFSGEHVAFATSQVAKVDKHLTLDEIVGQCFVFLVAGYDTTALSLAYTSFLLATHPGVQTKLREEIDRECPNPEVTFDQLTRLKYMDAVIKETLRMYPLASVVHTRKCMRDTTVLGRAIEAGTNVQVDTWTLHYDPKIWGDDADEFRPERWSNGESLAKKGYLPFGLGPRQCIGMRLAYMEEKLLLVHLLRKYTFSAAADSSTFPLRLVGRATTAPTEVPIQLCCR